MVVVVVISTYITLFCKRIWFSKNKGFFLGNFVPNSGLSPQHVDCCQSCQLRATKDSCQFVTLIISLCIQHARLDAMHCLGLPTTADHIITHAALCNSIKQWILKTTTTYIVFNNLLQCWYTEDEQQRNSCRIFPSRWNVWNLLKIQTASYTVWLLNFWIKNIITLLCRITDNNYICQNVLE